MQYIGMAIWEYIKRLSLFWVAAIGFVGNLLLPLSGLDFQVPLLAAKIVLLVMYTIANVKVFFDVYEISRHRDRDREAFEAFREILPSHGAIRALRQIDFAGSFFRPSLVDLERFVERFPHPEMAFINKSLEAKREQIRVEIEKLFNFVVVQTFPIETDPDMNWRRTRQDHEVQDNIQLRNDISLANASASKIADLYDALIHEARRSL